MVVIFLTLATFSVITSDLKSEFFFRLPEKHLPQSIWTNRIVIKGYLRYKTILCHKAALDV